MPARSAFDSLVSGIKWKLQNRSSAMKSRGTSTREGARPASSDSSDSMRLLKYTSRSRLAPKPSFCSFIRGTLATGLSKVRIPRTRHKSQTETQAVNTDPQRQRLSYLTNVFTRRKTTDSSISNSNNEKTYEQHHSHSTLPEHFRIPPLELPNTQSEASAAAKPPSINWHARPPDMDGTSPGIAELIVQPSTSPWGRRIHATSVVPDGSKWDASRHRRSISHFLGQVHKEAKTTRTGPFWDRKYPELNDAVTKVLEQHRLSGKGTPGGAWIGVREDTQRFSAWHVYKEDWKDAGREVKYIWDALVKPVTKRCLSSVQSRG